MTRVTVVAVLGVVLVAAVVVGWQRTLIYFPGADVPPVPDWLVEVSTTTSDGLQLRGWVARQAPDEPLLVVLHGNGGTAVDRLPLADALRPHGVAVLLAEYRGYGGNPGTPTEGGLTRDADAWATWAATEHAGPVAYLGESLGAAVAARLATTTPPAALVLRSPFTSLADVGGVHYPFLPLRWLLLDRYDVVEHVERVAVPVVVVVGADDEIVPREQSRAVFEAAADPERLVELVGARHNDLELLAGEQVVSAIVDLLQDVGALPR